MVKKVAINNNEDTPGDALKERGHGVIDESRWKDFDEMVDNNCQSWSGLRYVKGVIDICEIMHDESMPIEQRRRKAYDLFQEQAHNGCTAHMTMDALRHLCTDGETLADEIEDFKYDPNGSLSERRKLEEFMRPVRERERKIREDLMAHRLVQAYPVIKDGRPDTAIGAYSTNDGMFCVEFPYRYERDECLRIVKDVGRKLGLCYGIFNNVPMFSFDTTDTFFRRQHNGMTQEDDKEFMAALFDDTAEPGKAERILKERTWKHLGKRY